MPQKYWWGCTSPLQTAAISGDFLRHAIACWWFVWWRGLCFVAISHESIRKWANPIRQQIEKKFASHNPNLSMCWMAPQIKWTRKYPPNSNPNTARVYWAGLFRLSVRWKMPKMPHAECHWTTATNTTCRHWWRKKSVNCLKNTTHWARLKCGV